MMLRLPVLPFALVLISAPVFAAAEAPTAPYFASLKSDKVFMREGPGDEYRIKWVYHRKGLPMEVLASFDAWRRVRDMDGEIGWIHTALLSRDRTAMVTGKDDAQARRRDEVDSTVVAEVQPGAVGKLVACKGTGCEVKFAAAEGWIERKRLWGVHAGEEF